VRPFAFVGIGATRYDIGDIEGREVDGETKFSWTTGGGIKAYFTPVVGVKAMARWTPTYITTDAEGIWCDPIYCWVVGDAEYANQLEFSGGVTLRF
jgi:hypothetical protein